MTDLIADVWTPGATISDDGRYRYLLRRRAQDSMFYDEGRMLFVMLNPSTADATEDDPTIRRCRGFARREHCGTLEVVNLYAYRATDWSELNATDDPVGPENVRHVTEALGRADVVIAAWGSHWRKVKVPPVRVESLAARAGKPLHALRTTKQGDPGHPLYLPARAPLLPWPKP